MTENTTKNIIKILHTHPLWKCNTGKNLVVKLSKMLEGTKYMVCLPNNFEGFKTKPTYTINIINGSPVDVENTDGKFILFHKGYHGVISTNLKFDESKTNYHKYCKKLLDIINADINVEIKGSCICIIYENPISFEDIPRIEISHDCAALSFDFS